MQKNPKTKVAVVKKTTPTKKKTTVVVKKSKNPADDYKGQKDAWGNPVGGEGRRAPFPTKKGK